MLAQRVTHRITAGGSHRCSSRLQSTVMSIRAVGWRQALLCRGVGTATCVGVGYAQNPHRIVLFAVS